MFTSLILMIERVKRPKIIVGQQQTIRTTQIHADELIDRWAVCFASIETLSILKKTWSYITK